MTEPEQMGRDRETVSTPAAIGAAVFGVLTLAVIVVPPLFVFAVRDTYGPGSDSRVDLALVVALVGYAVLCGVLIAATWNFLRRLMGRPSQWLWLVGVVGAAVCALLPIGAALAGTASWERGEAIKAAACSTSEIASVAELQQYGFEFTPASGTRAGTCEGWIMIRGEDSIGVMSSLWSQLAADGWTTTSTEALERTWTRDGQTVRVWFVQSSDGSTGVGIEGID